MEARAEPIAPGAPEWTEEQLGAIARRDGELFLDAGAGSGKTAVLVERFVRAVTQDRIEVPAILTITFTDKAAGEMRKRIRDRLRELGATEAARETETAFISTIHGFCARVLRAHPLAAGIDPSFTVLDEVEAGQLADLAFDRAVSELAAEPGGRSLIASYGLGDLRGAVRALHAELRSRGQRRPALPAVADVHDGVAAAARLEQAAAVLLAELGAIPGLSARVGEAMARLERVRGGAPAPDAWPGEFDALRLPGGNGAPLTTPACTEYTDALDELRAATAAHWARRVAPEIGRLLELFADRYEQLKRERSALDFQDLELLCAA